MSSRMSSSVFRTDDIVKRRGDAQGGRGRVIGFAEQSGKVLVLVQWEDGRIFPNPTVQPEDALEKCARA